MIEMILRLHYNDCSALSAGKGVDLRPQLMKVPWSFQFPRLMTIFSVLFGFGSIFVWPWRFDHLFSAWVTTLLFFAVLGSPASVAPEPNGGFSCLVG